MDNDSGESTEEDEVAGVGILEWKQTNTLMNGADYITYLANIVGNK